MYSGPSFSLTGLSSDNVVNIIQDILHNKPNDLNIIKLLCSNKETLYSTLQHHVSIEHSSKNIVTFNLSYRYSTNNKLNSYKQQLFLEKIAMSPCNKSSCIVSITMKELCMHLTAD